MRCLALVAYTEAAVDGIPGMTAVIRVVRNRMADPRFPDDACAVIAQVAQFQPIAQSELLQKVARDPEGYSIPQMLGLRTPQSRRCWRPRTDWPGPRPLVGPDWWGALFRQSRLHGREVLPVVRRPQAHRRDWRPCVHDRLPARRARRAAGPGLQPRRCRAWGRPSDGRARTSAEPSLLQGHRWACPDPAGRCCCRARP